MAAATQARKPPSVGRSADTANWAATSANASRWARAAAGVYSGRDSTSMSSPRARSRLADQVGERQRGERPQPPHDGSESGQPLPGDRPDPLALGADPTRWGQLVEGLDDARPVGRVRRLVTRGLPRLLEPELLACSRPRREAVEVGDARPHRRAGEQPHEVVAAGGVLDDVEQGDEVLDLGGEQQPPRPTTS